MSHTWQDVYQAESLLLPTEGSVLQSAQGLPRFSSAVGSPRTEAVLCLPHGGGRQRGVSAAPGVMMAQWKHSLLGRKARTLLGEPTFSGHRGL